MKKTIRIVFYCILVTIISIIIAGIYRFNFTDAGDILMKNDPKNIAYTIDGELFVLKEGKASKEIAPESAIKNTLSLFEEPVYGIFGEKGVPGAAVLLVNNNGGSGTFYYAALAIASGTSYISTNAIFLGDRIAPQTILLQQGVTIYNYADRNEGEHMVAKPSIGKSAYIYYNEETNTIKDSFK